ncbi:MAG: CIA30 family protein [Rhodothermales bacterium]|nr:CIA30 family protein [Rhodothermales bacterium]MDG2016697.1 CIA30 family protein [Rhodothermales bacterium]HAY37111.1 CIA30 family protein [Bacteroidota bacterium]
MKILSILFALTVLASSERPEAPLTALPDTTVLFQFDQMDEASWSIVNDGVMGGRSKGYAELDEGVLRFWGNLVTRGGGFTSIRAFHSMDLGDYDGLELRVRGNGRDFEVELSDGTRYRGRQVSQRSGFATTSDWTTVRIPFESFRASIFGRQVRADAINPSNIRRLGIYILDGKDGPFALEVDEIRAYKEGEA